MTRPTLGLTRIDTTAAFFASLAPRPLPPLDRGDQRPRDGEPQGLGEGVGEPAHGQLHPTNRERNHG